ncbi:Protein HGH1 [Tolypocladium ophioglossoides CBS 100239]|uniref:Protein HGH1 homolog n=1 Tax=Tolypocladium ophioglossoides (strain CBS 100239) TaxID=1163406 RepID=A0A0L0N3M4_TOLOC|nr:Protein HGH1 [Tolypocladium ophioglossoides CBS 100239]
MPTELEELVGFIAHPNPQIRLAAAENLVPYSTAEPAIFKAEELKPVKNLKLLVKDHPKIAKHVLTILVNVSGDPEVLNEMVKDDKFLELVFQYIVNPEEPNANLLAMLLANLAKWDGIKSVLQRKQQAPEALGSDDVVLNQLMDLFVKGQDGAYNKNADFDYLAYVFADLAKHAEIRQYFVNPQPYDGVIPLTKLKVFTEHKSDVRRKGVASTIKNVAFDVQSHPSFLSAGGIDILPYVLLPITGSEEYEVDDAMAMLPDLQLLPPDKRRDPDSTVVQTHVETLTLLTTTREGRELMREVRVYPIVRETHLRVDDGAVREACERLVQVLMRDEEEPDANAKGRVQEIEGAEDDEIVEV